MRTRLARGTRARLPHAHPNTTSPYSGACGGHHWVLGIWKDDPGVALAGGGGVSNPAMHTRQTLRCAASPPLANPYLPAMVAAPVGCGTPALPGGSWRASTASAWLLTPASLAACNPLPSHGRGTLRMAVLVNEVGDVDIDSMLVNAHQVRTPQLAECPVWCTCSRYWPGSLPFAGELCGAAERCNAAHCWRAVHVRRAPHASNECICASSPHASTGCEHTAQTHRAVLQHHSSVSHPHPDPTSQRNAAAGVRPADLSGGCACCTVAGALTSALQDLAAASTYQDMDYLVSPGRRCCAASAGWCCSAAATRQGGAAVLRRLARVVLQCCADSAGRCWRTCAAARTC